MARGRGGRTSVPGTPPATCWRAQCEDRWLPQDVNVAGDWGLGSGLGSGFCRTQVWQGPGVSCMGGHHAASLSCVIGDVGEECLSSEGL